MFKKTLAAAFAACAMMTTGLALADRPGAGWISIEKAIETVKAKGYVEVYKIEAEAEKDNAGYWEGEGRKADGLEYEFRIDAVSGNVVKDQKD